MGQEAVSALRAAAGGLFVDGTLGLGGHTEAIVQASSESRVVALEWNEESLLLAQRRLAPYRDRILFFRENFALVDEVLLRAGIREVSGMLLDLGLSSFLIEHSGGGFSFLKDEPLDMRMDKRISLTAKDLVNKAPERELANIIYQLGEDHFARRIARAIVSYREKKNIETTGQLAEIVLKVYPPKYRYGRRHPATRTFQALRMAVNRELENLEIFLKKAPDFLSPGARLVVISFHSLEDRLVKRYLREDPRLRPVTKRPIRPTKEEITRNPRARSAKMRVAEKLKGPEGGRL
ncbi:16S rRNA (cytosine(1402)-N(4))-methyltransferase RsmH [Thermosulfuriphilus sp.]